MKTIKLLFASCCIMVIAVSCGNEAANRGASTPIDSTNVKGSAPATYGGNNPGNDQTDSNRTNANDTGTKANNVHNAGTR